MKRVLSIFLTIALLFCVTALRAESAKTDTNTAISDKDDDMSDISGINRAGKGKAISVEKIIAKLKERKEKFLAKLRQRSERLPDKLKKIEDKVARRQQRFGRGGRNASDTSGQVAGANAGQMKESLTERYEKFKGQLSGRKQQFLSRVAQRKAKITERIKNLSAEDQAKVMAEFESAEKEIAAEIDKMTSENSKKLEEVYQKLSSQNK